MEDLQHFSHEEHPLVYNENERRGVRCYGCQERVYGPSYSCVKHYWWSDQCIHHKSCAELPLGLHHPLHPKHPLILFSPNRYEDKEFPYENVKCEVCKEVDPYRQYSYGCSRCNFNMHITCAVAPIEAEFHDHPLTPFFKSITFTCDICGKEDKGRPYLCGPCSFLIHRRCARYPRRVKVVRHKHPLHLTHSSHEVHQSDSRFCQICVQKVDTDYGLYYCSRCDFVAHLDCAMDNRNKEDINLLELKDEEDPEFDESVDSTTEIAIEIAHFSHEHHLKLTADEVQNNKKCHGCIRAIVPPCYSCAKCSFFLHTSCAKLPRKKLHPLHPHPLTLLPMKPPMVFRCDACDQPCIGFTYNCKECHFNLDVQCGLISDILIHKGHEHRLFLSNRTYEQNCSSCDSKSYQVFRCITCEFALDFKCATLPHTTRYKQHEHSFTLSYTAEDDSGEYYCDICEEERDPKHWFYYCEDCSYPAHPVCILGKYPNVNFGGAYTFDCHPHPLTFIEETKDRLQCHKCNRLCNRFFYQCTPCDFNMHRRCL